MQTFTIEEAAGKLGVVAHIAFGGETVVLVSGEGRLELKPVSKIENSIPIRTPGWFNDAYDSEDVSESNRFAARSPQKFAV